MIVLVRCVSPAACPLDFTLRFPTENSRCYSRPSNTPRSPCHSGQLQIPSRSHNLQRPCHCPGVGTMTRSLREATHETEGDQYEKESREPSHSKPFAPGGGQPERPK